nr:metallophosphoesterase [Sutcliffiella deserti]
MLYLGWNVWVWLRAVFGWNNPLIYILIFALLSYSYILGRLLKFSLLSVIGSYWFAFVQYGLLFFPIANATVLLLQWFTIPSDIAVIWTGTITLFVFLFLLLYGTFNAYIPVIRHYKVEISKKHPIPELRIAVASDMHFGQLSGKAHVSRLVKTVNGIKPDLILFPGDIIDDDPKQFVKKEMGEVLKQLQAPLGVYGVLGNHEYYGKEIPAFLEEMKKLDIRILMDEVITIDDSFYLVGRKDKTDSRRKSFSELVENLDRNLPIIAMDHQPAELKEAERSGIDLLFSGHTHRGQMAPNHFITGKIFELDWGYLQKNNLHAVVSSGFGFWGPPIRIGSRSEVLEITVKFTEPKV